MTAAPGFSKLVVRGVVFEPALFCAPLAGFTHSAFRRVVAERFGGCGAFYTEMLSGKAVLHKDRRGSPYLKRNTAEPRLIFQLMLNEGDPIRAIVERLIPWQPDGLDLNLGCHAPMIRKLDAGSRLFENGAALRRVLSELRTAWDGLLSVKIRLGRESPHWRDALVERLKLFEDSGVDMLVVHARFFEDKFKRRARHEWWPWIAAQTRLPLIANGDIRGSETPATHPEHFEQVCGLMIGRMAIVQPWIFAAWREPVRIDYRAVWDSVYAAIGEDFLPEQALGRVKAFTHYYARNFRFGHTFAVAVQNAPTLEAAREAAAQFFTRNPEIQDDPPLGGLS